MHSSRTSSTGPKGHGKSTSDAQHAQCCEVDIHIEARGDVNIYNCVPSGDTTQPPEPPPCVPPHGTCIPVAAGAKHKFSRDQKLDKLLAGVPVPSALAAGAMHMIRRFMLGKTAANALEAAAFAALRNTSRDLLSCTLEAFDAVPRRQRNRLFAEPLLLDPNQPLDEARLTTALGQEITQRVAVQVFGNPTALDEERPGSVRVYEPQGEDPFSQVRICRINGLRTEAFIPDLNVDSYLPAEIQHDCAIKIVDGQPQVVCDVRTTDCPGTVIDGAACARVLDIPTGDTVILEGVNYFSVDAKVRFIDKQTSVVVRDVDSYVRGDVDTPVTEVVNGETRLVNDCRVRDQLTFQIPDDLTPGLYEIRVVVPNITGISIFGPELQSNGEYINVILPETARFEILAETISARQETSPELFGSDEVGLHTLASAFDSNFQLIDLPDFSEPGKRIPAQENKFRDIQNVDFDTGMTPLDVTRKLFAPDKPFLAMLLVVLGDEIDSQRAYDEQITSTWDNFVEIVKSELPYIAAALGAAGGDLLKKFSWKKVIAIAIALAVLAAIDLLVAWWAPADPIIRDAIALSVNDLAELTSSSAPAPDPATFTAEAGIVVNVNKTIPPKKGPLEYRETREYVGPDSRYEIRYRYSRVA